MGGIELLDSERLNSAKLVLDSFIGGIDVRLGREIAFLLMVGEVSVDSGGVDARLGRAVVDCECGFDPPAIDASRE